MAKPPVDLETVRAGAIQAGVCVRPVVRRLIDTLTGQTRLVPIPCGSTLARVCPSCAERARRLRMHQCREGWHLDREPEPPRRPWPLWWLTHPQIIPAVALLAAVTTALRELAEPGERPARRVRSTRRRDDVPDLPRLPVAPHTVGRTFTDTKTGKVFRPSMFLTVTMPSYGPVRADGTPVDPDSYDYRRAALDALHLPKLWDRFIQNLRRAVGYDVQYFATIEPQKRLAPHIHAAIRGAIPRRILRQVVAATYASVWWPRHDRIIYGPDRTPVWDERQRAYVDPDTGRPLPTWEQALDALDNDPDAEPAHVIRFGAQTDIQGIIAGTREADQRIGYLTKYLTKAITDPLDDDSEDTEPSAAREAHIDRLHREIRWLPCSPRCANWLAYGIQPAGAEPGMTPGECPAKAHDRDHLGLGGRRVLVSRKWTGKTLATHRADRRAAVHAILKAAGINPGQVDRYSATVLRDDGHPRYLWQPPDPDNPPNYPAVITAAIAERNRWQTQYQQAKQRAGPHGGSTSATGRAA